MFTVSIVPPFVFGFLNRFHVLQCLTIEWQEDKLNQSQRCYEFLFEEFKRFYLAYMFPSAFIINSVRSLHYNQSQATGNTQQTAALNVYSNNDLRKAREKRFEID